MSNDNPLKRLKQEIDKASKPTRASKANHTFYLSEPQYSTFAKYCRFKGIRPSEMVDKLIELYLLEVRNDLPPEDWKPTPKASGD